MAMKIDASTLDLKERVVAINRVSKTVKGGRIFKFAALVVVGDGNGIVGFGIGNVRRSSWTRSARAEDAKKNLQKVALRGSTIPHEIVGEFGSRPCSLKAGSTRYRRYRRRPGRAVVESVGTRTTVQRHCVPTTRATLYAQPSPVSPSENRRRGCSCSRQVRK